MAPLDIRSTTTTDLDSNIKDYSVDTMTTDGASEQDETYYDNPNWTQWFAYYKTIPEYKTAINAFATWVIGKGWEADSRTKVILERIDGWGEDTFLSIIWNLLVTKKVGGDAFAEIIRADDGTLLNLKPLDPGSIRIVVNRQGRIKRYEQRTKTGSGKVSVRKFKPSEILHLCNDRIADEIHGTSITESVEWVILARNDAMSDWRKVLHRNVYPIRIIEVDEDDTTKLNTLKTQWKDAIKKGEVLILPKGTAEVKDNSPIFQDPQGWIKYLENFFYQALGVPKVILGGSEEFTEASSKIGYLTFEQVYSREVSELIADLWNQLGIRIEINKPASLKNEMLSSEEKNTGQVGFQPNDVIAGVGK